MGSHSYKQNALDRKRAERDRLRIQAFERDWERRRRNNITDKLCLCVAVLLFVHAFGIVVGWW